MVTLTGVIPKVLDKEAHDTKAETFMFFEEQTEWNKKYLTYTLSDKEKHKGYMIPSATHTYSITNY